MSNKTNCYFKKGKNENSAKLNTKNSETHPIQIINQTVPKKTDYTRKTLMSDCNFTPSENVVILTNESTQFEKKSLDLCHEE